MTQIALGSLAVIVLLAILTSQISTLTNTSLFSNSGDEIHQDVARQLDAGSAMKRKNPKLYTVRILDEHTHDRHAFTQGFLFQKVCKEGNVCQDEFLESTGIRGKTSVRKVDRPSGQVSLSTMAKPIHFGEGLTRWKNKLIQLTWLSPTVLLYDANTLQATGQAQTQLQDGWGLTNNSNHLIATDSGHTLFFLNPDTLKTEYAVPVTDNGQKIRHLNELEYINGEVWANIWQTNCIARIEPSSGTVQGWILLDELTQREHAKSRAIGHHMDVLNGIAYDPETERIWVTGKLWTTVYQVEVVPKESNLIKLVSARKKCIIRS